MMTSYKRPLYTALFIIALLVLTVGQSALAETRYVSDKLIISMREGRSPGSPAVAFLVAGTPVEVLEVAENHLLVKIANGQQGWVRSKYILKQRPKTMIIKELEAKIEELENQIESMEARAGTSSEGSGDIRSIYELKLKNLEAALENEKQISAAARTELKEIKSTNEKLQADLNRLSEQKALPPEEGDGADALRKEVKRLRQTNQELSRQLDQKQSIENASMLSSAIKWFLAGSGVLLLGLILGRSVTRKNPYGY